VTVDGRGIDASRNIARVVARHFGLSDDAVESALAQFEMPEGRLNRIDVGGLTVIDDSFNANPSSMRLALETLAETGAPGSRRIAILGPMRELGDETARYHREIGDYARRHCDLLLGVGDSAQDYGPDRWFADSETCAAAVHEFASPGDCLLIKGSASAKMGAIVTTLRASTSVEHSERA
jgi:UDP-N-acetylmuramoyl-tripeptide--D-alanyl-D-alanine ligase